MHKKENWIIHQSKKDEDSDDEDKKLPKVYPPFLQPLNPNSINTTYTLVVDLDETLVHLIEVK